MSMFSIPGLNNYKTALAGWTKLLGGLLYVVAELFTVITGCLDGTLDIQACYQRLPAAAFAVYVAADGLATLGLGDKLEKLKQSLLQ